MILRSYWNVGAIAKLPPKEITEAMIRSGDFATYGLGHFIESPKERQFSLLPCDPHECKFISGDIIDVCTLCGTTKAKGGHQPPQEDWSRDGSKRTECAPSVGPVAGHETGSRETLAALDIFPKSVSGTSTETPQPLSEPTHEIQTTPGPNRV